MNQALTLLPVSSWTIRLSRCGIVYFPLMDCQTPAYMLRLRVDTLPMIITLITCNHSLHSLWATVFGSRIVMDALWAKTTSGGRCER